MKHQTLKAGQFINFLVRENEFAEFETGIMVATEGATLVQYAMSPLIDPKDYIIEAFGIGAIPESEAWKWNKLNDLWREVLNDKKI